MQAYSCDPARYATAPDARARDQIVTTGQNRGMIKFDKKWNFYDFMTEMDSRIAPGVILELPQHFLLRFRSEAFCMPSPGQCYSGAGRSGTMEGWFTYLRPSQG